MKRRAKQNQTEYDQPHYEGYMYADSGTEQPVIVVVVPGYQEEVSDVRRGRSGLSAFVLGAVLVGAPMAAAADIGYNESRGFNWILDRSLDGVDMVTGETNQPQQ